MRSGVDLWRIYRPLKELSKHVDWQIDHQPTFIKGIEKYKNAEEFTEMEMQKAFDNISTYDIIFSSYHADPTAYTMLKVARDKTGTQFIMDVDDDMFSVNPDNPFWVKMTDEKCYWMQCMIRDNDWISTTTEDLAYQFRKRRENSPIDSVFVNPNSIDKGYKHKAFDNGDKVVIGYFGGSSHYKDLHDTGVAEALEQLMNKYKHVHFKAVGMPLDKYIPRGRYTFVEGKRGDGWKKELFPNLNMDISIGPLHNNLFNKGKSNIKWQESTRAGACFVASREGPYKYLKPDTAMLTQNDTESWYEALEEAVLNEKKRKQIVQAAKKDLKENYLLENNWTYYKEMFLKVYKAKENHADNKASK